MHFAGRLINHSGAGKARQALKKATVGVLSALSLLVANPAAQAETEFKLSDEAGVTAGIGLRTSISSTENGAGNGTSSSTDFTVNNARLFFSGHYGKIIKGTLNTDYNSTTDAVRIMDAYVGFEFNDYFNVWLGRFLPPQDRANGYGPFYSLAWSYPVLSSNYPMIENGRDNGVAAWGKLFNGKLVWAGGAFEGHNKNNAASAAFATDKPAFSGRLIYHAWDPEPAPAYLAGGWYGGSKDILTFGLGGYTQKDGAGAAAAPGKLEIWNADVLFEKKTSAGVPTLEGAYYVYGVKSPDCGAGGGCPATVTTANLNLPQFAGKAWLASAAWLFNGKVGWGQIQPYYRYQKYEPSIAGLLDNTWQDIGVNYIIKGPNAKISAQYTKMENGFPGSVAPGTDISMFVLGVQLIY
jgi:hypothetical protein